MRKKRLMGLALALASALCVTMLPATALAAGELAYASTQKVDVDGQAVEFQMYALKDENGNDTNYVKVRDVAKVLNGTKAQFQVTWDGAVNLVSGQGYTADGSEMSTPFSGNRAYTRPTAATKVNGQAAELDAIILTDDAGGGYTYYKLRDLGSALGFTVDWSAERGVYIETGSGSAEVTSMMYAEFPDIPDFTAVTGIPLVEKDIDEESVSYFYNCEGYDPALFATWIEALEENGYTYMETIDREGHSLQLYWNGVRGVGAGAVGNTLVIIITSDISTEETAVPMYANHPDAPDFGAVTGLPLSRTERWEKSTGYFYSITNVELSGNEVKLYDAAMTKSGYTFDRAVQGGSSQVLTYTKGSRSIAFGLTGVGNEIMVTVTNDASDPTPPASTDNTVFYSAYPGVPDFGACLGISYTSRTERGYFYSYDSIENSGNADTGVAKYGNLLRSNGFTQVESPTESSAVFYNAAQNCYVTISVTIQKPLTVGLEVDIFQY